MTLSTGTLSGASAQNTTEMAYTGNGGRVAVARSGSGWATSGSSPTSVKNVAATTFGQCSSGSETETYSSIGRDSSGAGERAILGRANVVSCCVGQHHAVIRHQRPRRDA